VGGKRIVPARPFFARFLRHRRIRIVLTVVEDNLEKPCGGQWGGRSVLGKNRVIGRAIAVLDALQVAVSGARRRRTVCVVGLGEVDGVRVFLLVAVYNDVAFIVIAFADEPGENASRIGRVGNTAFWRLAIPGGNVVPGDRAPAAVLWVSLIGPALDTCKQ